METEPSRRHFIQNTAVAGAFALNAGALNAANAPSRRVRVGVMGLGRGLSHIRSLLGVENVEIAYVCDVDRNRLARGKTEVSKKQKSPVKGVTDFREILDDGEVDALTIAAPNFWHAPATILACSAGKHVYVEKPGSHNAAEAELMVKAARTHKRLVQMGNQRRSYDKIIEAIQRLREGVIGKVFSSRCWYRNARGSIGRGKLVKVPAHLDYTLWQGPVPERPYKDNLVHYNWHWHWNYGGGEMANNGVHALDLSRWGLGVDLPRRVTYSGGRYHHDDDQETPDTGDAIFDFGESMAIWSGSSCHRRMQENLPFVAFYGQGGSLSMTGGNSYTLYDSKGKELETQSGPTGDVPHFKNFIEAIRGEGKLNSEIAVGQSCTLWCHLANIAYRTGGAVDFDPDKRRIQDAIPAMKKLWSREYRKGWEPKV
jgi:predicted dehydrogenase